MKRAAAVLILSLLVAGPVLSVPASAQFSRGAEAQQERRQGFSIFRFLKRNMKPRTVVIEPPPGTSVRGEPLRVRPGEQAGRPAVRKQRQAPARKEAPPPVVVEKLPDAKRVLVIGDFMASALAKGLTANYAANAEVVITDASEEKSGLLRDSTHDWGADLQRLLQDNQAAAIVVMTGANDRQPIQGVGGPQLPGTEGWADAYSIRAQAFARALVATGKPVLWGSLVPAKSSAMSRDFSAMNGVFRDLLEGSGIVFVDLWNGFADAEGRYISSGPDMAGQNAKLRATNGIGFTTAGQQKLAFFVRQQLEDMLKQGAPLPVALTDTGMPPEGTEPSRIGPMLPIEAAMLPPAELLSTTPAEESERGGAGAGVIERLAGGAEGAYRLRADSYGGGGAFRPASAKPDPDRVSAATPTSR